MIRDFNSALRQFRNKPLFSALVTLLVAVGVGANVLIFGFVDILLLKPLPVRNPDNLWILETVREKQVQPSLEFSYGQYEELRRHNEILSALTAEQEMGAAAAYPAGESTSGLRSAMTQMVAPNYFQELGVTAYLGRVLTEADASTSTNVPAVISYQFWQSRFGGRADILGQTIRLKNYPFTIVGVLPRDFHSVDIERAPDVRLPISAAPFLQGRAVTDPRGHEAREGFRILGRLRTGVSPKAIEPAAGPVIRQCLKDEFALRNTSESTPIPQTELQATFDWINQSHLALEQIGQGISRLRTQFAQALKLLMYGVVVLLLTVCANVAGLLLARGEERRKELAVRLSIGASRWRLLSQLMIENLCLAIPGGVAGVVLAYALAPSLLQLLPPVRSLDQYASPQILTITPDLRVLVFAWFALLVSVCFFGLFPAWRATRLDLSTELKGTSALAAHTFSAMVPVTAQIALSVLLLTAGGLMLRTYWNLQHLNPGFDRAHVVSFTLGLKDAGFTPRQIRPYMDELERRLSQLPNVRSLAFSTLGLMRGSGMKMTLTARGVTQPASVFLNSSYAAATPSYFETLGIPLLAGRNLDFHDNETKPQRIVINRALASLLFPDKNPIGQEIVRGTDGTKPPTYEVVGLVETAKFRKMQEPAPPTAYALLVDDDYELVVYVRTKGNPLSVVRPAEDVIRRVGGGVPLMEVALLEQEVQNSLWQERLVARLANFFSLVALLLAGIGLYGTLAYSVARRRRELGIRLAIGARVRDILGTVCGRMTWAVVSGLALGLLTAALTPRLTKGFLYDVDPLDKVSFGGAAVAVFICACLAALIPSWRAIRTDAAVALREQ
jgi:predicted permease